MGGPGIPLRATASRAIARREHYAGTLAVAQLPRLRAAVADPVAALQVDLTAGRDLEGAWLRGEVRGELTLTCQRGLHPYSWPCAVPVDLRLVETDAEEARLLKDCDPYRVENDTLPLRELVEEEVLLALPMMPRCDDPECATGAAASG